MSKTVEKNEWITLKNGNLIMFLHHNLPSLQANNKAEWNALGDFLLFLDDIITRNTDASKLSFIMSKKEISKYSSSKYFDVYLKNFFIDSEFFFSKNKLTAKTYNTFLYLNVFISKAQKYLIETMGIENYLVPLKINLTKVIKKSAYLVALNKSQFIDKDIVEIENAMNYSGMSKQHPIFSMPNFIKIQVDSFINVYKQKDLITFYGYTERESRKAIIDSELLTFETKRDLHQLKVFSKKDLEDNIYTKIVLNKEELNKFIEESNVESLDFIFKNKLKQLYLNSSNFVIYKEANIRLYTPLRANIIDFQGISKEIKKKLFKALWQYDLNAAAPTIFYQLHKKFFPLIELKILESYIEDRNAFRNECSKHLVDTFDMDKDKAYESVKEIITALFYGANLLNPRSELILPLIERKSLVNNISIFKELIAETNLLFNDLYKYYESNFKVDNNINLDGYLINLQKKDKKGDLINKSKASILSSVYFFYERVILDIVRESYEDLTLLIHDGFIIPRKIDKDALENIIYDRLGFKVKYSEEQL